MANNENFFQTWSRGMGIITDDIKNGYENIVNTVRENIQGAQESVGRRYQQAGEYFQDGDVIGGLGAGAQATAGVVGNIATFGMADRIGRAIAESRNIGTEGLKGAAEKVSAAEDDSAKPVEKIAPEIDEAAFATTINKYMSKDENTIDNKTVQEFIGEIGEASDEDFAKTVAVVYKGLPGTESERLLAISAICSDDMGLDGISEDVLTKLDKGSDNYQAKYGQVEDILKKKVPGMSKNLYADMVNDNINNPNVAEFKELDGDYKAFIEKNSSDKQPKPLSEKELDETISRIIETADKAKANQGGGFNPDYAAAKYLVEDAAKRDYRWDVKPTEVLDRLDSLEHSGGQKAKEEYLRQTLSQREFENDGAQADKIEGVVDKKAERSEKANEAFGDIVAADEANIQSDVQCGE